jgi:hypothetical protein
MPRGITPTEIYLLDSYETLKNISTACQLIAACEYFSSPEF